MVIVKCAIHWSIMSRQHTPAAGGTGSVLPAESAKLSEAAQLLRSFCVSLLMRDCQTAKYKSTEVSLSIDPVQIPQ